ncbi:actin cytoskeleton and mitosis protein [Coemansia sp. Benny D160-2]|nr:actin cytoskeleton and mitosis protein [Coemansia sp. Benny D160-2]
MDFGRTPEEEARLKALRRQRFNNTEAEQRYKKLVGERAARRRQLEQEAGAGTQGRLVGTCTLMCPAFEREEREMKNALAPQEFAPGTRRADPRRAVKTFHRSAAGNEEPLPEDLRTGDTLLGTLDYLVDSVVANDQTLVGCHGFVRDRTRSIRQDFTIQNIRDRRTVAACERIARFHILSLHVLCGHKDFAEQQDLEQLRNTLKTLIELYDDHRKARVACPNEAEFYAYYVVAHLHDSDAKRVAERLPRHIFLAPIVQQALRLHMLSESSDAAGGSRGGSSSKKTQALGSQLAVQGMATQFFRAVASDRTPFLLACLAECFFPRVRRAALRAMNSAFPYQQGREYPVAELAAMLAFDSVDDVRAFCALFSLAVTPRGVKLGERAPNNRQLVFRDLDYQPRRTARNLRVVGAKFLMTPMQAINSALPPQFLVPGSRPPPAVSLSLSRLAPAAGATRPPSKLLPPQQQQLQPAGLNRAAKAFVPSQVSAAGAFASTFTGILDQKPRVPPGSLAPAAKKRVSFAPQPLEPPPPPAAAAPLTAFNTASSRGPGQAPLLSAANQAAPVQQGLFGSQKAGASTSAVPAPFQPPAAAAAETPSGPPDQKRTASFLLGAAQVQSPDEVPPAPANQPTATATVTVQEAPAVVWNRPRHRINWTSLSHAVYYNLVESLVRETVGPLHVQTRARIGVADALAADIAKAIVDYTSAFIAYEASYRCVLFAQADALHRRAAVRGAFARWSMEFVVARQDSALRQQYVDDLDDLLDAEYMAGRRPRHQLQLMHQNRVRSESAGGGRMDSADAIDLQLGLPLPAAHGAGQPSGDGGNTVPADFWDSAYLGREGFEALCGALRRHGAPAFRVTVALAHTRPAAVLHSWMWWQIDPSSIALPDGAARSAAYANGRRQTLLFSEHPDGRDAGGGSGSDARLSLAAQIVLLSHEPLEPRHLLGGGGLGCSGLELRISSCVEGALEAARARATNVNRDSAATSHATTMPLLFVFWYTDPRVRKAVRRMVESVAAAGGVAPSAPIRVVALDIANSKQQLVAGMRWMFRQLHQSLRSAFVRAHRAYAVVCDAMVQSLRRMRAGILVSGMLRFWPCDTPEAAAVFNDAVAVANMFIAVVNTRALAAAAPACPRLREYPRLEPGQIPGAAYFGQRLHSAASAAGAAVDGLAMVATNPVVGSAVDETLCSGGGRPTLGACLRALEIVVKSQADEVHQAVPADGAYADKLAVSAATKHAVQLAAQLADRGARLLRSTDRGSGAADDPFTTPRPKRSSSLAFSCSGGNLAAASPPLSLFGAALDADDDYGTPECSAAPSVVSAASQSTAATAGSIKRQRASPSFNLTRLQGAIARASKHLK